MHTEAVAAAMLPPVGLPLRIGQLIGGHHIDGLTLEDDVADTQRLQEFDKVLHCGDAAGAAAFKAGAKCDPGIVGLAEAGPRAGGTVKTVNGRYGGQLLVGSTDGGVVHTQGLEDVFLHILGEGNAGDHFDHRTKHIMSQAVVPLRTGFKEQGLFSQCSGNLTGGGVTVGLGHQPLQAGRACIVGKAGGHGQKMADGDSVLCRQDLIPLANGHISVFGKIGVQGCVQRQQTLFPQLQSGGTGDHLTAGIQIVALVSLNGDLIFCIGIAAAIAEDALTVL